MQLVEAEAGDCPRRVSSAKPWCQGRAVGDVVQERGADAQGVGGAEAAIGGRVALDEDVAVEDVLRQTVGAGDEVAVRVGGDHRDVVDVGVDELQTELVAAWSLISDHVAMPSPSGRLRNLPVANGPDGLGAYSRRKT